MTTSASSSSSSSSAAAAAASDNKSESEGAVDESVVTLFVSGFPLDTSEREIQNMFRCLALEGFVDVSRRTLKSSTAAFATFQDHQSVVKARTKLNGWKFYDYRSDRDLRAEVAKGNTKKRGHSSSGGGEYSTEKRQRGSQAQQDLISQLVAPALSHALHLPQSRMSSSSSLSSSSNALLSVLQRAAASSSSGDQGANTTLYVSGLKDNTQETELREVFANLNGFKKMRLGNSKAGPVAFADFTDTTFSAQALAALQGSKLPYSGATLSVAYAKSQMGQKKAVSSSDGGGGGSVVDQLYGFGGLQAQQLLGGGGGNSSNSGGGGSYDNHFLQQLQQPQQQQQQQMPLHNTHQLLALAAAQAAASQPYGQQLNQFQDSFRGGGLGGSFQ